MRAPLSWLRDFAPFPGDIGALRDALDDLGLVVEAVEHVGEGMGDVVVSRVLEISAIKGADRIRRVLVDAGGAEPLEIVCGAHNFAVGDRVPLAPVGAILPGGFEITARSMRGVVSNGMLCSGRELGLSDDGEGLLILGEEARGAPGTPLTEALGLEPDTVFDITVEGNRPDAWCMAGVARDLAARLDLPYAPPEPPAPPPSGRPVETAASAGVASKDLCPRLTVSVLDGVVVGPSPQWIARRLLLAGMRPINNVVDASNYVMLELGQPTHPYDLASLPGRGLTVRRAEHGETLETLDGVRRTLGVRGRGLGDTGEDCLICDAEGTPVGIGGIMGGASSEISASTTEVLLEAAYFAPMAIARVQRQTGVPLSRHEVARLIEPIGFTVLASADAVAGGGGVALADDGDVRVTVVVPTNRPDVRPEPYGVDDVIEEIARMYGYSRLPRRVPTWPQPGGLTSLQRSRRTVKDVLCGLGASEGWTDTFVSEAAHAAVGLRGPAVRVSNPLDAEKPFLRRSLMPGLLGALAYNAGRRQPEVRLYEVGVVFTHPDEGSPRIVERSGAGGRGMATLPGERELLCAVFARDDDDARQAVASWHVVADAFQLGRVRLLAPADGMAPLPGLHPTRSAHLVAPGDGDDPGIALGSVGEIDPDVAASFGLTTVAGGSTTPRRIGWLEIDLGLLFDEDRVPRRLATGGAISRFPSSDIDLALVVDDRHPADEVADVLRSSAGDLLESVRLFDVYRGPGIPEGSRSLAYRLRFCSPMRTLTDEEVGELRSQCIEAVAAEVGAVLR